MTFTTRSGGGLVKRPKLIRINASSAQARGLVACWPMNGPTVTSILDAVRNDPATLINSPLVIPNRYHGGYALRCDAATGPDYAEAADHPRYDITGALTLSTWMVLEQAVAANNRGILAKYITTGNQRSYGLFHDTSERLLGAVSSDGASGTVVTVTGATILTVNTAVHAVLRYVPSTSLTVFVNGRQDGINTTSIPASLHVGTAPVWLGQQSTTSSSFTLNGLLWDCRIYDRALTDPEIWALYDPKTRWDLYRADQPRWMATPPQAAPAFDTFGWYPAFPDPIAGPARPVSYH